MSCEGCKERREAAAALLREMRDSFLRKVGVIHMPPPKEIQPPKVDSPSGR
jgi:hypothetical protein